MAAQALEHESILSNSYKLNLQSDVLIFRYQLSHICIGKFIIQKTLDELNPKLKRYMEIVRQIKAKSKKYKSLLAKNKMSAWRVKKQNELTDNCNSCAHI